jgi:hypothetical protein
MTSIAHDVPIMRGEYEERRPSLSLTSGYLLRARLPNYDDPTTANGAPSSPKKHRAAVAE